MTEIHALLDKQLPNSLMRTLNVADHIVSYWFAWLIVPAGALGLFEWKCRSENKEHIRTVVGVAASLVSLVIAFWVAGATMAGWANVFHDLRLRL